MLVPIKSILNPKNWINTVKTVIKNLPSYIHTIYMFSTFFILLIIFLISKVLRVFRKIPIFGKIFVLIDNITIKIFARIIDKLEVGRPSEVKRTYLIELAYKNMMVKKARSLITIFGMSIGVGAIVLLLSLGYGIERLIINKVAGLNELKMIDVSSGENTTAKLSEEVFKKIKSFKQTDLALPVISVVGRVSYNQAMTDVLVYAVTQDYIKYGVTNKMIKGQIFANNNSIGTKLSQTKEIGQVAGETTELIDGEYNKRINNNTVEFNILPGTSVTVWSESSISSKALGYTTRLENGYTGISYWGNDYYPFSQGGRSGYDNNRNIYLGRWIKAKVPLYEKTTDDTLIPKLDDQGRQLWEDGFIPERDIVITNQYQFGNVLGESTSSAEFVINSDVLAASDSASIASESATYESNIIATNEAGIETVSLEASDSANSKKEVKNLKFEHKPDAEAIVSSGLLNLLGININRAVGTTFKSSFIIVKSLMPDIEGKVMTSEVEYKIIGVLDDPDNTYFYIPFTDLYKLGIKNFSQFKMIVKNQKDLPQVRKDIETMGFRTNSTYDTVKQIESLFANLRLLLAILGMVALGVASLGMFNTLTVSLLERTRETGGMKAIGMVSEEVQDLFLAEAMIMGLSGGIGGLLFGGIVGQTISIIVSIIAISRGQGYLQLNYLPPYFVIFILICAFVVGLFTGLYPAYRAKKTSALNALRYE